MRRVPVHQVFATGVWVTSMSAEKECKCDLRTRLVGDGCEVCNPELARELEDDEDGSDESYCVHGIPLNEGCDDCEEDFFEENDIEPF